MSHPKHLYRLLIMINICYLLIVLLLLLADSRAQTYKRIKDYNTYLNLWQQKKQNVIIHDVSNLAPIKDQCDSNKCKFVYYEYKQLQERTAPYNRTVLMVSGMHGNEFFGPHVLLYGQQHFKGAHIIYFPIANPSGFQRQDRYTYPQKLDPNRDFPIDSNTACYQTYSTIVLDYIFRKYPIDVTFILHNGGSEIGFNWGTLYHQANSHTDEYYMQLAIAEMLKRAGGSNSELGIQEFKVGTMTQVIYPATGTFDDWAFAASRYPSIITKCQNHNFQPYSSNMTNGLVFLIELGPHKNELFGSSQAVKFGPRSSRDGYVSRGIRMLKSGLQIVNPSLSLKIKQNAASLVVRGCSSAEVNQLDIIQHTSQTENSLFFSLKSPLHVQGTVRKEKPNPSIISFQNGLQNGTTKISYKGSFTCSKEWLGKGTTFFATNRKYEFNQLLDLASIQSQELQNINDDSLQLKWYQEPEIQKYALYLIILLGVLVLMSAIFAVLRCICAVKTVQKQEKTQFQQDYIQTGQDLHTARGGIINQM